MLYDALRDKISLALSNMQDDEALHGRSRRIYRLAVLNALQHYLMLIYAHITNSQAGASDWEEVKELYDWNTMKKCFACSSSLNLDTYAALLELETLCETGIDTINS